MKEQRVHQMQVMEEQGISTWTQVEGVTEQLVEKQKGKLLGKKDVENQVGFSYTAKMWSEGKGG